MRDRLEITQMKRINMECKKPCFNEPLENNCESCIAELESAAIQSAMNMGPPDWMGPFTEEELAEILKFLDNNRELMKDLEKLERKVDK